MIPHVQYDYVLRMDELKTSKKPLVYHLFRVYTININININLYW